VAGDPSDPSASAPPFPPSAASTAPIPADVADFARRAPAPPLARRGAHTRRRSRLPPRGVRIRRGDEYGGRRRARPDRRARGGRRPAAFDDWTVERISYRELDRCGTPRDVDIESVFAAADRGYPTVWDTVDRGTGEAVCVPNAPGPILHGIRGDDANACREIAEEIASEPVERTATFLTNQGTDAHLAPGAIGDLRDGAGYRVAGVVARAGDETRGHVHVDVAAPDDDRVPRLRCVAFKPTGRFRDRVRALRPGDRVTVCGEHEVRLIGDSGAPKTTETTAPIAVSRPRR